MISAIWIKQDFMEQLEVVDDRRIWVIAEALRRGVSYDDDP